jgi:NAD(P)-dependent dehydrogenase (short-subunit alcohol dehydrogenase family)
MKAILITGASRGIGRAAALLAGARGWSVAVNYADNRQAAEETAGGVRSAGGQAAIMQGDVSSEADVIAMFDAAERAFGPLDGVVVNAGIIAPGMPLAEMSAERMRRIFEVNVLGAYLCAREAARRLPKSKNGKGGSIVLMSSVAARLGAPFEYVD